MALVFPPHCIQNAPTLWPFQKCDTIHKSTVTLLPPLVTVLGFNLRGIQFKYWSRH